MAAVPPTRECIYTIHNCVLYVLSCSEYLLTATRVLTHSSPKQRPYVTFRNKIRVLWVRCPKNNVHVRKNAIVVVEEFSDITYHNQGRSQKFIVRGYNFLLHDTTVLYTSSLTTSAAISAKNNFQGLILGGYIYRYTPPRRYASDHNNNTVFI